MFSNNINARRRIILCITKILIFAHDDANFRQFLFIVNVKCYKRNFITVSFNFEKLSINN